MYSNSINNRYNLKSFRAVSFRAGRRLIAKAEPARGRLKKTLTAAVWSFEVVASMTHFSYECFVHWLMKSLSL